MAAYVLRHSPSPSLKEEGISDGWVILPTEEEKRKKQQKIKCAKIKILKAQANLDLALKCAMEVSDPNFDERMMHGALISEAEQNLGMAEEKLERLQK